jgi:hypothetical protein
MHHPGTFPTHCVDFGTHGHAVADAIPNKKSRRSHATQLLRSLRRRVWKKPELTAEPGWGPMPRTQLTPLAVPCPVGDH